MLYVHGIRCLRALLVAQSALLPPHLTNHVTGLLPRLLWYKPNL
jgi:hypothetical protein